MRVWVRSVGPREGESEESEGEHREPTSQIFSKKNKYKLFKKN